MHHGHPVPHRAVNSSRASRTSRGSTGRPVRTSPGASTSTKPTRPARRFLSPCIARHHGLVVDGRVERGRQPARGEQLRHLGAQRVLAGEPERGQQPERDGLAVAVARVAGRRLDPVPDGVAEVEHVAAAAVALVLRRRRRASCARTRAPSPCRARRRARTRSHSGPPAISAVLTTSAQPGRELGRRERGQRRRVDEHGRRLVVGARVVLALREVDAGLAAVRRVDLRHERRRHLHDRHAALVGGGAEAGEVADHAAAEREHVVAVLHARGGQAAQHAAGLLPRLRRLAGRDRERRRRRPGSGRRTAGRRCRR